MESSKLKDLVKRYSEFINFPIYLWESKEITKEVEDEDVKEDDGVKEEVKEDEVKEED